MQVSSENYNMTISSIWGAYDTTHSSQSALYRLTPSARKQVKRIHNARTYAGDRSPAAGPDSKINLRQFVDVIQYCMCCNTYINMIMGMFVR